MQQLYLSDPSPTSPPPSAEYSAGQGAFRAVPGDPDSTSNPIHCQTRILCMPPRYIECRGSEMWKSAPWRLPLKSRLVVV